MKQKNDKKRQTRREAFRSLPCASAVVYICKCEQVSCFLDQAMCLYQTMFIQISTRSATTTTNAEMINPCSMGFAPAFFMLEKDVFSPMAASAQTMRNLLVFLVIATNSAGMEIRLATITIAKNPKMNQGNTLLNLKFALRSDADCAFANASFFLIRSWMSAKVSTVGMMASVLVSFTMVAKSPAASEKA